MAKPPLKISPLQHVATPRLATGEVGVTLSHRLCTSLTQVQSWPGTTEAAKKAIDRLAKEDTLVMPTGPGRWLIDSENEGMEAVLRKALPPKNAATTGLTHARVVINVSGKKAEWVLASGIALDFSLSAFPVTETRLSHHHEIGLTIHRLGEESFDLYVFTSFARGFWHWIERAGQEVGLRVD